MLSRRHSVPFHMHFAHVLLRAPQSAVGVVVNRVPSYADEAKGTVDFLAVCSRLQGPCVIVTQHPRLVLCPRSSNTPTCLLAAPLLGSAFPFFGMRPRMPPACLWWPRLDCPRLPWLPCGTPTTLARATKPVCVAPWVVSGAEFLATAWCGLRAPAPRCSKRRG